MNEKLKNQLYWEKFRPTTLDEIVLPDRIMNLISKGVHTNLLFHGTSGIGKSTLAKILIQDHPYIILESKLGVDDLRSKVDRFCKEMSIMDDPNKLKIVFFEEFDRASRQLQDELKSFIEKYSDNVRFIATTNNLKKIDSAITSRFNVIDFNLSSTEYNDIRIKYKDRIVKILKEEKIEIPGEVLRNIIVNKFPDFRAVWQNIQQYEISGFDNSATATTDDDEDVALFNIIFSQKTNPDVWDFLYANWHDKMDMAFQKLGRDLFNWIKENKSEKNGKLADMLITVSNYTDLKLPNATDPFVTLCALVFELRNILN